MKKTLLLAGLCALGLTAAAQNPYAYGLYAEGLTNGNVDTKATALMVNYTLNNGADAVTIDVYDGETLVKSFPVTDGATVGAHAVSLPLTDLPKEKVLTWKVNVKSAIPESPSLVDKSYVFWSPYGIAIDNNTESDYFGRILVTETQSNMSDSYWTASEGVKAGVYAFDPQLQRIKNAEGTYGYRFGINFNHFLYPSGNKAFGPKKVRISKDGRIFLGIQDCLHSPIYEITPDLGTATPVFVGNIAADTTGVVSDAQGNFIAGASAAFDVTGEGDNLKLVNLSCKGGQVFSYGAYQCYEYKLGKAKTIETAVTDEQEVMDYSMQYTISAQSVSLAYDNNGGLWYCQYRGAPSDLQPAVKHINAKGEEDYSDITTVARGGGIAFNRDFSLLAMPTASKQIGIFQVDYDVDGKPTLTKIYTITGATNGCNDIAFDYADNLYTCCNSNELFVQYRIPRLDETLATPAAAKYAFTIPASTGVADNVAGKVVAGVKYYNVAGVEASEPFSGINVVVTNYTDGTKTMAKVVK